MRAVQTRPWWWPVDVHPPVQPVREGEVERRAREQAEAAARELAAVRARHAEAEAERQARIGFSGRWSEFQRRLGAAVEAAERDRDAALVAMDLEAAAVAQARINELVPLRAALKSSQVEAALKGVYRAERQAQK